MNAAKTETQHAEQANGAETSSQLEALRGENASLKHAARLATARDLLTAALTRLGAASPMLLFESAAADLQFDDAGTPTNAEALVASLRKKYPEQFSRDQLGAIDAGAGRSTAPQLTKEMLARMKPAEIAELDWNDVRRVLAS